MSYEWASYASPTSCTPRTPLGATSLAAYLEDVFPYTFSMGICNCRLPSHHSNCRAYDCGIETNNGAYRPELGDPIHQLLGPVGRRLGLDHLILNRIIYSARSPNGREYKGVHPHRNHAHIGLTAAAGLNLNYASIVAILGPPIGGEIDMWLHGLDIGDGSEPSVRDPRVGTLQAFLVAEGYNLGTGGPNKDGVDGAAGPISRGRFHDWKITAGITGATSGGSGIVGDYEAAAMLTGGVGPKGDKGDKGATGSRGAKGATGSRGTPGIPGENGADGADGADGKTGSIGAKGTKGDKGIEGPEGPQGEAGVGLEPGQEIEFSTKGTVL